MTRQESVTEMLEQTAAILREQHEATESRILAETLLAPCPNGMPVQEYLDTPAFRAHQAEEGRGNALEAMLVARRLRVEVLHRFLDLGAEPETEQ